MTGRISSTMLLAGAALAAACAACGRGASELDELGRARGVAQVGAFVLDDAAVERQIQYETGMRVAELDPLGRARMREELLAEALLARGAERAGVEPSAKALADELARLQAAVGAAAPPAALQQDARRRVLARIYERDLLGREIKIDAGAVEQELARDATASAAGEQVVFRQIRLDSEEAALRAHREILAGQSFDRLAAEMSVAPDRGRPLSRALAELPPAAAAALRGLREGEATRPVELDGAYYLFQLDARGPAADVQRARRRDEAQRRVFARLFEDLRERRLEELARQEGVRAPVAARPQEDRN